MGDRLHRPVMLRELMELLELRPGLVVVDCTVGMGGHAAEVLRRIEPGGTLIGIDRDGEALEAGRERLGRPRDRVFLFQANFADAPEVIGELGFKGVERMYLDLGVSSMQLESAERGFSFQKDGPLDMRMDRSQRASAANLVNRMSERDLERVIREYGEERWAKSIARAIVRAREKSRIETTGRLSEIVSRAIRRWPRSIHPATRTFQALRIAVNDELESLRRALAGAPGLLTHGGIIAVISFHSLDDRIVKWDFRRKEKEGFYRVITKKPLVPSEDEVAENPRARSAKLRAARKEA